MLQSILKGKFYTKIKNGDVGAGEGIVANGSTYLRQEPIPQLMVCANIIKGA